MSEHDDTESPPNITRLLADAIDGPTSPSNLNNNNNTVNTPQAIAATNGNVVPIVSTEGIPPPYPDGFSNSGSGELIAAPMGQQVTARGFINSPYGDQTSVQQQRVHAPQPLNALSPQMHQQPQQQGHNSRHIVPQAPIDFFSEQDGPNPSGGLQGGIPQGQPDWRNMVPPQNFQNPAMGMGGMPTMNPSQPNNAMQLSQQQAQQMGLNPQQQAFLISPGMQVPQQQQAPPSVVVPNSSTSFYPEHPRYAAGFIFKVFNDERTHFIHLPSQYVLVTEGSNRYLNCGNTEQMAPRFVLCRHILRDRLCPRGSTCNFIHGVLRAAEGDPNYRRVEVHKNDATEHGGPRYETLPPGAKMLIAYPGEERHVQIPSQNIYKTRGSELYHRVLPSGLPPRIPQRCTHYQFKKMCHRGAECNFIHIAYDTSEPAPMRQAPPSSVPHMFVGIPQQQGMGQHPQQLLGQQQVLVPTTAYPMKQQGGMPTQQSFSQGPPTLFNPFAHQMTQHQPGGQPGVPQQPQGHFGIGGPGGPQQQMSMQQPSPQFVGQAPPTVMFGGGAFMQQGFGGQPMGMQQHPTQ
eukprot:PhF_6_TR43419/c3_g1_i1/m.66713